MKKPRYLSPDTWEAFVLKWLDADSRIRCVIPDCDAPDEDIQVDHIVSRFVGGNHALSNLQPMCGKHNSEKSGRPDRYWDQELYFDQPLNVAALRAYQSKFVYEAILEQAAYFAQPISSISGKLLCFVAVVASGKTLGAFCVPFAINACVRRYRRAQPRIDRMLLVTKGTALRSQIADELSTKSVKLGLVQRAPMVAEITDSSTLLDTNAPYHIGVMCPNMLWPHYDASAVSLAPNVPRTWIPGIDRVVQRHPLIIFDEMHYAAANIAEFVDSATNSLVFGFTATPFHWDGRLLENIVLVSVFSYQNAMALDGSMKYIR